MLHVLNGDSARMGLERSGIAGAFVVWPDVLYEGPTPLSTGEEWIAARVGYLASAAARDREQVAKEYRRNDGALEAFRDDEEVVFWFEHDLFDQLLLIRHLWRLRLRSSGSARASAGQVRIGGTRFSLVCRDIYLGPLKPEEFPPLFDARQPITTAQLRLGADAWTAFCGDDPSRLLAFTTAASTDLPFLAGALRRHLEDFPSAFNGLSRSEAQILQVISNGPLSPVSAFRATTALEERMFMGDLSFWNLARGLATAPHPLIVMNVAGTSRGLPAGTITLTDAGRGVLAGSGDHVALNGIDRWLGGVHLAAANCWRWNGRELLRA